MKWSRAVLASIVVAAAMGCGGFGDSDLETEVGQEPNNVSPEPIDGFTEERNIAVGAKHLVTPTDGTRITVAIPSNPDIVNVPQDAGDGRKLEIKCVTPGTATIDINLESTSSSQTVAGEFVANCFEPESLVLSPMGYSIFGTTKRMPYTDRIVTTMTDVQVRYDVFAMDKRLAGYAYDPFLSAEGVDYTSRPQTLTDDSSTSRGRYIDLSVDQSVENPALETVLETTIPVDVITPDSVEDVVFTDVAGKPLEARGEDLSGSFVQVEALWKDEPVWGLRFDLVSQTPEVCEVTSMDELSEEEGDASLPLFQVSGKAAGTCEVQASVVDGGGVQGVLTFGTAP